MPGCLGMRRNSFSDQRGAFSVELFRLQEGSSHLRSFSSNKLIQRHTAVRGIPNFFATVLKRTPAVKSFNAFFRNSADAFFIKLSPESCLTFWGQFKFYSTAFFVLPNLLRVRDAHGQVLHSGQSAYMGASGLVLFPKVTFRTSSDG